MEKIEKQLSDLREESGALRAQWENEKKAIKEIQQINAKIDQARVEEQTAQREGNLGKVAEIRYGLIRECEQKLKQKHKELQEVQKVRSLLNEEVDADDIATVVSKWTGIPVTRMLEGEKEKAPENGRTTSGAGYWPGRGNQGRFKWHQAGAGGTSGPEPANWHLSVFRANGCRQDGALQGAGGLFV